jgi:hypothetical protein
MYRSEGYDTDDGSMYEHPGTENRRTICSIGNNTAALQEPLRWRAKGQIQRQER